jgi:2'-5' RNA ligase
MNNRRLFFALWPDDRQRDSLRNTISPAVRQIEGAAVLRGNWHVTLAFIGDFPEARIPALQEAARAVRVEPFRLRFDRVEYWPRPKIAVLVAQTVPSELQQLVDSLDVVLEDAEIPVEDRRFRPHVTIARRARPFETQRLAQAAIVEWSGFKLVESLSSGGGADYQPI